MSKELQESPNLIDHLRKISSKIITSPIEVSVVGQEYLSPDEAYIIALGNHTSHADAVLTNEIIEAAYAAAGDHFSKDIALSLILNAFVANFMLDRKNGHHAGKQIQNAIEKFLVRGKSIAFFVEGGRQDYPQIPMAERRIQEGAAWMAMMADGRFPIVPGIIKGAEGILHKKQLIPNVLGQHVTIAFGEHIYVSDFCHLKGNRQKREAITDAISAGLTNLEIELEEQGLVKPNPGIWVI
jgi:1-acyl-sn-glycerol-3-phosphate acyltransferase